LGPKETDPEKAVAHVIRDIDHLAHGHIILGSYSTFSELVVSLGSLDAIGVFAPFKMDSVEEMLSKHPTPFALDFSGERVFR
jgi:hypothetical protein